MAVTFIYRERRIKPDGSIEQIEETFPAPMSAAYYLGVRMTKLSRKGYEVVEGGSGGTDSTRKFRAAHPKGFEVLGFVVRKDEDPTPEKDRAKTEDERKARIAAIMPEAIANAERREARKASFKRPAATRPVASEVPVEVVPVSSASSLHDGYYTVVRNSFERRTYRVKTVTDGNLAGKRIVAYLAGPDNENDYVGFAFLDDATRTIKIWRKFQSDRDISRAAYLARYLFEPEDRAAAAEAYAIESGRCARCGRVLTVPASIHRGYGPECFEKLGLG